jgi:hypothetical protein
MTAFPRVMIARGPLHSDPYPSREAWCPTRVEMTERRLAGSRPGIRTVSTSHFPLIREPAGSCVTQSSRSGAFRRPQLRMIEADSPAAGACRDWATVGQDFN